MGFVGLHASLVVVGAVLIDALFGEVPSRVHPVVGMGSLTRRFLTLRPKGDRARHATEFAFGVLLVMVVVGVSAAGAWAVQRCASELARSILERARGVWGLGLGLSATSAIEALALSTLFAGRGLMDAGKRMRLALGRSLDDGREALSHLCSRDPKQLEREELCGATVESLAENASDSFVAPLFWYVFATLLGGSGLIAAAAYRAANTLDAMVGYRGQYEYVGKCAARLDDLLNWVPARVTALTLLFSSALCRLDVRRAWEVAWKDHGATESPNAGWPMATAAGALGVELSKRDCYVLGHGLAAPNVDTIAACERLIGVGFGLFTLVAGLVMIGAGYV